MTALALLAGCAEMPVPGSAPLDSVALFGGTVQVASPEGYCVDRSGSEFRRGFVLMAACPAVADVEIGPRIVALISLQVGQPGTALVRGGEAELAAFLATDQGARVLAGGPGDVTVAGIVAEAGVVEVQFEGTPPARLGALAPGGWRAFLDLGNRLATVTVYGLAAEPITAEQGRRLLRRALGQIVSANQPEGPDES